MIEKQLEELQANYDEIADLCRKTGESVSITAEGVPTMVLMDINAFKECEARLKLLEQLVEAELDFSETGKAYDVEEVERQLMEHCSHKPE